MQTYISLPFESIFLHVVKLVEGGALCYSAYVEVREQPVRELVLSLPWGCWGLWDCSKPLYSLNLLACPPFYLTVISYFCCVVPHTPACHSAWFFHAGSENEHLGTKTFYLSLVLSPLVPLNCSQVDGVGFLVPITNRCPVLILLDLLLHWTQLIAHG